MGSAFQSLVTLVVGLVVAFTASWRLALAVLGFMPLLTISAKIQNDMFMGLADTASSSSAIANQLCSESIQGIRTVRAFNIESQVLQLYEKLVNDGQDMYKKALTSGLGAGASQMLMFALYWVAFFYGGWLIKGVGASGNDIMTSFMAMMMAGFGIGMASMAVPDKAKSASAANAVFAMIRRESKIAITDGEGPLSFDGGVELKDVEFAYPSRLDRPILKTINLSIEAGKTTALVGPSGSGKSTIIAMLQRFYDPTGGALLLGGSSKTDLKSAPLVWWRKQIGFVGQEPVLFKGTIAENIRYGNPDASQGEIEAAARKAFAHDFIMEKTRDKYETEVGERGGSLSGGQKQRIAIARALVRNPKLLLLDEATSALDNESEHEVQMAIDTIIEKESMTCVVIAHRLNTVRHLSCVMCCIDGYPLRASLIEYCTYL
jgi:ATP-binding cassette subfamily B (MDR/TAP) protein 1